MFPSQAVLRVFFVLYGLAFGSFANVVIWRLPRGESLSDPPSRCPACSHPIRWYDNVPVVSWLILHGRCRDCGVIIPARYPLVEALSGALFALAAVAFPDPGMALGAAAMFWFLMVLTMIDLEIMRLPNPLVAAMAAVGLTGAAVAQATGWPATPLTPSAASWLEAPLVSAAAGVVLGAGTSLLIAGVYSLVRKTEGFGMGDVKLLGAMGLYLGPYVLLAFFAGTVFGAMWGAVRIGSGRAGSRDRMPFGPFLAVGGILAALFGPWAVTWYLGSVGVV